MSDGADATQLEEAVVSSASHSLTEIAI